MNRTTSILFRLGCVIGLLSGFVSDASAQANRVLTSPPAPPMPMMRSPVDSFRALLVLPAEERRAQLATRPAEIQKKLAEKIREYQALTPDEQELRLKATELRWYLQPLMTLAATNRPGQLDRIPENLREMVAVRIAQWDKFPRAVQQMMLTNQAAPNYLVTGSPTNQPPLPSPKFRNQMHTRFNQFFELTTSEKDKVLATLSDVERRQMEKTLAAFDKLPKWQREQCIVSFTKFTSLTPEEQQEFLKNAGRWVQMSADERQAWRELVSKAPRVPPLPMLTRKPPPLPRNFNKPAGPNTTNGG